MSPKQQMAMAYDLALTFTKDEVEATEMAEAIIRLCRRFFDEETEDYE